jgi:hypothetical protein
MLDRLLPQKASYGGNNKKLASSVKTGAASKRMVTGKQLGVFYG